MNYEIPDHADYKTVRLVIVMHTYTTANTTSHSNGHVSLHNPAEFKAAVTKKEFIMSYLLDGYGMHA
jgi:hypothetical protein